MLHPASFGHVRRAFLLAMTSLALLLAITSCGLLRGSVNASPELRWFLFYNFGAHIGSVQIFPGKFFGGLTEIWLSHTMFSLPLAVFLLHNFIAQIPESLIEAARDRGHWKLVSRIFPANVASRALCRRCGFREVGVYEKHGRLDGRWLDVVIVERLIHENIVPTNAPATTA